MKATIKATDTSTGAILFAHHYDQEIDAQEAFDTKSYGWSEWDNRFAMDLIAHHPTHGDLTRRTLYTASH